MFTTFVDLVSYLGGRQAVPALHIARVDSFALELLVLKELVERNMSDVRNVLFVEAIDTLCMGPMLAHPLHLLLSIFGVEVRAVQAPPAGSVVAFGLLFGRLVFLLSSFLLLSI